MTNQAPNTVDETATPPQESKAMLYGSIGGVLLLFVVMLALTGALGPILNSASSTLSGVPSESLARQALQERLAQYGGEVVSFTKTNGRPVNMGSSQMYEVEFQATYRFPNGVNLHCKNTAGRIGGWAQCMGAPIIEPGGTKSESGSIGFEKTENGWRALRTGF